MVVLSNGYKLPETGDFGDIWFPALEDNIKRVNTHNHDGTNSAKVPTTSLTGVVQTILSGDFAGSGGVFTATITVAGGAINIDNKTVVFRDPTTKEVLYLKYVKVSTTQITVTINVAQDVEVLLI